ncbi:unnamed protein product [Auanema sp. JU1783]|nr:unnamed protein product [Auanema sp. JU1783]
MQTAEGYASDNGPPKGSRLAKYMGANRGTGSSLPQLNANVPSFVPQFAKLGLSDPNSGGMGGPSPFNTRPFVPSSSSNNVDHMAQQSYPHLQDVQGGTTYYFPNGDSDQMNEPDSFTTVQTSGSFTYHGPLPHIGKFRPKGAVGNNVAQFISPDLKLELVNRQLAMDARADMTAYPELPQQVEHLNNITPLETIQPHATNTVYKALSIRDGVPYCIRRIHNFRLQSPKQLQPLENWKKLVNVNIVQLREVIPNAKAFGDNSLLLVYDYFPLADTLRTRHFGRQGGFIDGLSGAKLASPHSGCIGAGVIEGQLWSYVIQISSALRAVHASGLAARCLDLSKILVHGKSKILLGNCGFADLVSNEHHPIQQQQLEDLHDFGRVLLSLATGNVYATRRDQVTQSMVYIATHYSADMKNLINFLLSPTPGRKSINEIMPMIGARFYGQLEGAQLRNDVLENELSKELENGRLFRLLCKLNTIVERPEHNLDIQWAETGDRFLLKLFRDYVFHQVMENGKPWLDMAHIVHCLNKLDAGVPEKIELVSRDGDNLIIVSYGDLKRCIETAFRDLTNSTIVPRH